MGSHKSPAARRTGKPEVGIRDSRERSDHAPVSGETALHSSPDAASERRGRSGVSGTRPATSGMGDAGQDRVAMDTTPAPASGPPAIIDGRYVVEDVLGQGSASVVYLCRHLVIERLVAIKVLRHDFLGDPSVRERFANESRAATAIGNEHIVETLDYGTMQDGSTYIVMELLEGYTLGEVIASRRLLEYPRILKLLRQVTEGLGAAHSAGIIHRDVKPDNLFIVDHDESEFVKVLDFGVAKMASAQAEITRAGTVFGTPHYMSPEQAEGSPVDVRADIYSLGVIMYQLACGEVPFDAEAPLGILTQHMTERPPSLRERLPKYRELPEGYEAIVLKCLSKKPDDRYATMAELGRDLAHLESGLSPSAVLELAKRRWGRWGRWIAGHRVAIGAALFGATAAWALAAWLTPAANAVSPVLPDATASSETGARDTRTAEVVPAASEAQPRRVDLVLFPLDARVFLDDRDLGPMPVFVDVPPGASRTVLVKRKGYITRKVILDGTESRVVVGLRHQTMSQSTRTGAEDRALMDPDEPRAVPSAEFPATAAARAPRVAASRAIDGPARPATLRSAAPQQRSRAGGLLQPSLGDPRRAARTLPALPVRPRPVTPSPAVSTRPPSR
jgi:eukaryotic-like serine/threonine-protein kinase